jgi:hypothetical protein
MTSARTYAVAVVRGNQPYLRIYASGRLEHELPVRDPLGLAVDLIVAHGWRSGIPARRRLSSSCSSRARRIGLQGPNMAGDMAT